MGLGTGVHGLGTGGAVHGIGTRTRLPVDTSITDLLGMGSPRQTDRTKVLHRVIHGGRIK